ncbi:hypothetical protein AGMMS49938_00230 [Fibrobacterales bacterium]|nr:hypothetical protein AGMMS49938_00230 [Fibrobacterales bacterium]
MLIKGIKIFNNDGFGQRPKIVSYRVKQKTKKSRFILPPVLIIILAATLLLGYTTARNKIIYFLSHPIILKNALIIPENFVAISPLKYEWNSIKIVIDGSTVFINKPKISIDPFLGFRRELLNVSLDSVNANIALHSENTTQTKDTTDQTGHLTHPNIWLPVRVYIVINKSTVSIANPEPLTWSLDTLKLVKSARAKRIYTSAQNIRGTYLANSLNINADYHWSSMFSDASLKIASDNKDSLQINLNAKRERLEDISAEISASVKSAPFWLAEKYPSDAPTLENIIINSNVAFNIINQKMDFNINLKSKIGELWQLPKFDADIFALGNNSGISQSEITLLGDNNEKIKFSGSVDKNLDGNGSLEVSGINIVLGGETLPTDVKFHQIVKKGNSASAIFTTGAGSNFNANIADLSEPLITFTADIAPSEPWAIQWCEGNLKLARPTLINGSFSFKDVLLKATVRTKVPYAYYAAADDFEVDLWLNGEGIRFPRGTIKRGGYTSDFTGEVMWDKEYLSFKLNQRADPKNPAIEKGDAETYITFNPKMNLKLHNINTQMLPFANYKMLNGYNGIINGNWIFDIEHFVGNASVEVATAIQNQKINVKSDVYINGDSLAIKNFELDQNDKKLNGHLTMLTNKFQLLDASIDIPNIDLASISVLFGNSMLKSGFADGKLGYGIEEGLKGNIVFSKLALSDLDTTILNFPNLKFNAKDGLAKLTGHIFAGNGLWDGDLILGLERVSRKQEHKFFMSYSASNADNVGTFKFDGISSDDFKNLHGKAQLFGDWFLPNGVGEIKNANTQIFVQFPIGKNILDELTANFTSNGTIFEKGFLQLPVDFYGRIQKGILLVDSAFVLGENNEKINAKMTMKLASAELRNLTFNTDQFTILLQKEHLVQIKNASGYTESDSAGISIFAKLPNILYKLENSDYGNAEVILRGEAEYKIPFQTETTQANASITGYFDIDKAEYKKEIDLIPDPLHLDKTLKTLNKFITSALKEKGSTSDAYALAGRPTTLNIKVNTSGMHPATVYSNIANFPFAVNLSVLGTTRNMLLSGDINTVANGKIGYQGLTMFDLSHLRFYWQDSPWKQGKIELAASNNYPFCTAETSGNSSNDELCTVNVNLDGTFSRLNMQPTTNCNIEASPALIYYSMMLGCISADYESNTSFSKNKFTGMMLGKLMTSGANRVIGGNVVGDIEFNMLDFFDEEKPERDTNYVRVPISLARWVPSLEAVFGYTKDESIDPRYNYSIEAGLRYSLPVFDSSDISRNLIDPSFDVSTNLVSRHYSNALENGQEESRLEKNIGLLYSHKFWDPCILGIGRCKVAE